MFDLAAIGGDLAIFDCPDCFAGVAALAPVPKESGRIHGNLKRRRHYDRRLLRACYLAAHHDTLEAPSVAPGRSERVGRARIVIDAGYPQQPLQYSRDASGL